MRYFDFIKEIKEISTSHILVNEYGEGDIYEYLNNGEHKYPCIFLTVTNLTTTSSGTAINFTLFYTDRLLENQANKTAIQSTGISVIKQILSRYEQLHPEYLLSNVEYTPFTEKFTDMCAGVFCDIVIENQIDKLEDYDNDCEEGDFETKTLKLTKNGVYDVIGYDTTIVDVKFDKLIKVSSFNVDDNCIVDGVWLGDVIDVSNITNMSQMFRYCEALQFVDLSGWDVSNVTNMSQMFQYCTSLQSVGDLSNWDVSNVTTMGNMFSSCYALQFVDLSGWDVSNVTNISYMFYNCTSLTQLDLSGWETSSVKYISYFSNGSNINTYVGGRTIDEVISGNIGILNGLNVSVSSSLLSTYADRASLRALINGVADRTGQSSLSMSLGDTLKAKLTPEDIAIATAKNWTIS